MKKPYEVTVVFRIENNEDVQKANLEQVKNWIEANGQGVIKRIDTDHWGRRRLAYEIDGQREGLYVIFFVELEPSAVAELDHDLRLAPSVLRYLIVRPD